MTSSSLAASPAVGRGVPGPAVGLFVQLGLSPTDAMAEAVALEISEQIQDYLDAAGISASQFARSMSRDPGQLRSLLDGQQVPTVRTLARIANAMAMDLQVRFVPRQRRHHHSPTT